MFVDRDYGNIKEEVWEMMFRKFYEKLEKISDWIDWRVNSLVWRFKHFGIMYFIPGFRRLVILKAHIEDAEFDMRMAEKMRGHAIDEYNREKYFWMKKK